MWLLRFLSFSALLVCVLSVRTRTASARDINLTPNDEYDLKNWRMKYTASKIPKEFRDVLFPSDCKAALAPRAYLKPPKMRFLCSGTKSADASACLRLTHPAIAVISSNRAAWIKDMLMPLPQVTKANTVFYNPARHNRQVIIFVNKLEFDKYKATLGDQVTVVGCEALDPAIADNKARDPRQYGGFGFNRYCAVAFFQKMKEMGRDVKKFWMVDDNLREVTKLPLVPPQNTIQHLAVAMEAVEAAMDAASLAAVGFGKPDQVHLNGEVGEPPADKPNQEAIKGIVDAKASSLVSLGDDDFLEQAYVFDLARLGTYNFSPKYVLSKEDMSFTKLLARHREVRVYSDCHVHKYKVTKYDGQNAVTGPNVQVDVTPLNPSLSDASQISVKYGQSFSQTGKLESYAHHHKGDPSVTPQLMNIHNSEPLLGAHSETAKGSEPWNKWAIKSTEEVLRRCAWKNSQAMDKLMDPEFHTIPLDHISVVFAAAPSP